MNRDITFDEVRDFEVPAPPIFDFAGKRINAPTTTVQVRCILEVTLTNVLIGDPYEMVVKKTADGQFDLVATGPQRPMMQCLVRRREMIVVGPQVTPLSAKPSVEA